MATIELQAGQTKTIRVDIPTQLRGDGQRVVVETGLASDVLDMVLFINDESTPHASTSGPAYFQPGDSGLRGGFYASGVATQAMVGTERDRNGGVSATAISVDRTCIGPCIATAATSARSHVVVTLKNVGSGAAIVPVWAYVEPFIDPLEPGNDTLAGAPAISTSSDPLRGAIELLGDEDFISFVEYGPVVFEERLGYDVGLVFDLYEFDGMSWRIWSTLHPGQGAYVQPNEYGRVRSNPSAPRASVVGFYTVGYSGQQETSFGNPSAITIPAAGAAAPYPSTIFVEGQPPTLGRVTVTLAGMNHTYPADLDILLVGPGGEATILMSDAGGSADLVDVTLTFDMAASESLSIDFLESPITTGTYLPTNAGDGDVFPAPAPAGPYPVTLDVFTGTNPNGTWSLFVFDDLQNDQGNIAGGWSITITSQ